jgi:eukaryotic-like serine/threonine-protein kinase
MKWCWTGGAVRDGVPDVGLPPVLHGRYRLGPVLGRGGASVVYRARDELLGRDVAIKAFHTLADNPEDLAAQQNEARLLAGFNHPGLVTLLDAGVDLTGSGTPQIFLVMELVPDADLREQLRAGPLDLHRVAYLGWDLANTLQYVHERGVIHRDLKPANVLLVYAGPDRPARGKLADFGIARLRTQTAASQGFTTGTAAYLSPEQVEGRELGEATDVYSLGLLLLEAATGRQAFPGPVLASAIARLDRDPEIPSDIGEPLAGILRSMTARSPGDRPTAAAAALQFRRVIGDRPTRSDPEAERLAAVARYNLVDTPPDGAFDRLTTLAARLFHVPIAIVTIVDADRIWFKSHHGVDITEVERREGLDLVGGLLDHTLVVEDAESDPRLVSDPVLANARGLRFYAGTPLISSDGFNLGTLCIADTRPRPTSEEEILNLEDLAAVVLHEMELRRATRRALFSPS